MKSEQKINVFGSIMNLLNESGVQIIKSQEPSVSKFIYKGEVVHTEENVSVIDILHNNFSYLLYFDFKKKGKKTYVFFISPNLPKIMKVNLLDSDYLQQIKNIINL